MTVLEMIEELKKMPENARVIPCRPARLPGEPAKQGPGDFIEVMPMGDLVLLVSDK